MGFQHIYRWNQLNLNRYLPVQSGSYTLNGNAVDITIATMDTTKAVLEFSYESDASNDDADWSMVQGEIISSTQIRFRKYGSANNVYIKWFVWEATPSTPMTVQRFNTQTGTSLSLPRNHTITAVDLAHTFLTISERCDTGADPPKQNNMIRAKLTSTTNVECDMNLTNSNSVTGHIQVVEHMDWDVQSGDTTVSGTSATGTLSPAIALADSYVSASSEFDQSVLDTNEPLKLWHSSTTQISFARPSSSGSHIVTWYVADTNGDFFTQHTNQVITSGNTSQTATKTATDVTKTFLKMGCTLNCVCPRNTSGGTDGEDNYVKIDFGGTPATQNTISRNASPSNDTETKTMRIEILT